MVTLLPLSEDETRCMYGCKRHRNQCAVNADFGFLIAVMPASKTHILKSISFLPEDISSDELRPALSLFEYLALVFADDRNGHHIEPAKE